MRSLPIPEAEPCLESHAEKTGANWNNLEPDCRISQRGVLVENQNRVCAWCEQTIDVVNASSHVDHIKTQAGHPRESLSLENIVASCNGMAANHGGRKNGSYCGHARKRRVDIPDCVNPYKVPNLESKYTIRGDGAIQLIEEAFTELEFTEAHETINVQLNLNDRVLRDKRANRLKELNSYAEQLDLQQALQVFPEFLSMTHQFF